MGPPRILPDDDAALEEVLRRHAARLNGRWWRWPLLGPSYHVFADALVWLDEEPPWWRLGALDDALKFLWHYRTGLMLGEARPGAELWELGRRLFPRWVGFCPSRRRPLRRHLVLYRAGRLAADQCVAELWRKLGGPDTEQAAADRPCE